MTKHFKPCCTDMEERVYISSDEQVLVDCDTRTKMYELKNFKFCPYCGKPTEIIES